MQADVAAGQLGGGRATPKPYDLQPCVAAGNSGEAEDLLVGMEEGEEPEGPHQSVS